MEAAAAAAAESASASECAAAESVSASESAAASPGHRRRFMLNLPPGFHFCPREDELIVYYLRRKMAGLPLPLPIFVDERITSYSPQQIIDKYREHGENRWYFFTKRERRYAKGNRPYRTTADNGYWKATGNQRQILSGKAVVGRVRTLVFYFWPEKEEVEGAPAPEQMDEKTASKKQLKTTWTMYEYENLTSEAEAKNKDIDKMDELVLCTIQKKQRCDDVEGGKKKKAGQKGSPAGGNGEQGSSASGKKRKMKENIKAQKGTVQGRQADHPTKRSTVPMPPKELSQSPPEGGNHIVPPNMHMVQYSSCPMQRSPPPPQEPPHPEMMVPPVGDSYNFDANTAMHQFSNHPMSKSPVPSPPQGLPQSMMVPPSGGDNCKNLAPIMGMNQQHTYEETTAAFTSDMTWTSHGSNSYGTYASMVMGNSYGHHPFLQRSSYEQQPYLQQHVPQHSTVAPPGVYNQSDVARNTTGYSNHGYAHSAFDNIVRFPSLPSYGAGAASTSTSTQGMFMGNGVVSNNHKGSPASQHHGGRVITGGVYAPAS